MAASDPSQVPTPEAIAPGDQPATLPPETAPQDPTPAPDAPSFGWNRYAERLNGRFAMVGFVALLLLEFFTRQDFFTWLGF